GGALAKLLTFAISLAVVPICSYFMSLTYVWRGNANYAAITAIVMANVVLVSYIIVSILEDKGEPTPLR
ncbi:uncharacterized protein EI90DRAFT_2877107, partial [Cantharellus anzutake]|uniref:uncharacterized protein n=1 Tax=Cantharellus anzutake TaxID=1750568 RepID=UPI0019053D74